MNIQASLVNISLVQSHLMEEHRSSRQPLPPPQFSQIYRFSPHPNWLSVHPTTPPTRYCPSIYMGFSILQIPSHPLHHVTSDQISVGVFPVFHVHYHLSPFLSHTMSYPLTKPYPVWCPILLHWYQIHENRAFLVLWR